MIQPMADANLVARIGSACVFVPAVLVLVAVGGWALLALVLAIVGRASWEYAHMCRAAGRDSAGWLGTVLAMLLCLYAHQYGADGWRVFACCRKPGRTFDLSKIVNHSNDRVTVHQLDVDDPRSVADLKNELARQPLDVLVNNAGIM